MKRYVFLSVTSMIGVSLCACVNGPDMLQASRARYNEVIQKTTDEQLLRNLVRLRYRDAPTFLEVGSVSAQFVFTESADVTGTLNEGPNPVNRDRLTLGAGVGYQERPTIIFTPLGGKEFYNALLAPMQPELIVLLSGSGWSVDRVLRLTVQKMNGVDNASTASGPTPDLEPQYKEFAELSSLFRELQRVGRLNLGYESRETQVGGPIAVDRISVAEMLGAAQAGYRVQPAGDGAELVLTKSTEALVWRPPLENSLSLSGDYVDKIIGLLGLAADRRRYEIRAGTGGVVENAAQGGGLSRIDVSMRSLMATLFYLSQAVEVPKVHEEMGLVTQTLSRDGQPFSWERVTGDLLRVHSRKERPSSAAVAVKHRGYWFYIDDADLTSKSTFTLLGQLFALQAGGVESVAPVLTLPVGG